MTKKLSAEEKAKRKSAQRKPPAPVAPELPVDKRPKYQCTKTVHAHKIESIRSWPDGGAMIKPAEPGFAQIRVPKAYIEKHKPEAGGYIVYYEDGYISFSPAGPFEAGYTLID